MTTPRSADPVGGAGHADRARQEPGPTRFARYALPPNELGYCGPDDHTALLEYGASGVVDGGLRSMAAAFDGAWPYLELIAGCHGIADPLEGRVIDAYWLGGPLLDGLATGDVGRSLEDRFRNRGAIAWGGVADAIGPTTRLSHGFHVLSVYPWVGLLRSGSRDLATHVLDRCRVRWGEVIEVCGDEVAVRSRRLTWDGSGLALGAAEVEQARVGRAGTVLVAPRVGDQVALHWDWVCEVLDARRLRWLRHDTAHQIASANVRLSTPGRPAWIELGARQPEARQPAAGAGPTTTDSGD
jgi:hypothetical protein